jgi:mono/diheme cytochrome c family protein
MLAGAALLACAMGFAQSSGEAIYKEKCLRCHGATGLANTVAGITMKVKPITDPGIKNLTEAEMIEIVRNGKSGSKMQSWKSELSSAQIKGVVDYYRTFLK